MQTLLFDSLFSTSSTSVTVGQMGLTFATSLLLGLLLAAVYKFGASYSKEFVVTLIFLPSLIALIIFLVNGNLGTSVAVAGAFSLIRFRSAAGSARELLAVFMATAIGLATGMGYLTLAVAFSLVLSLLIFIIERSNFVQVNQERRHVLLTVATDFDYDQFFEKQFSSTVKKAELASLHYKPKKDRLVLEYLLQVDRSVSDKEMMDTILLAGPKDVVISRQLPRKKTL
ncbi:hypothetical protein J2T50_000348 [Streptococcus gallinaceus]|uniref:DUF4956 domain-containing protein n=1 Tax=Streptococcus gallinaceus TaxID=165758 RepID=UPI0020A12FB0|nr:DUF4956 domain-containing protein [Streptococcus gallinaceus]MCP1638655.1 hypothetical protein [Streptococcus gallinaceus]MCP1769258.1 hypothetical protein [Streptococcus gallinaceus]